MVGPQFVRPGGTMSEWLTHFPVKQVADGFYRGTFFLER